MVGGSSGRTQVGPEEDGRPFGILRPGPSTDGGPIGGGPRRAIPPTVRPNGRHRGGHHSVAGKNAQHARRRHDRSGRGGGELSVPGKAGSGTQGGGSRHSHDSFASHDGGGGAFCLGPILGRQRSTRPDCLRVGCIRRSSL